MSAYNDHHLYEQLQAIDMELVNASKSTSANIGILKKFTVNITNRDLIQFFVYLEHMQASEIPLLQCLANSRDSSDNKALQDIISELHRDVSEGMALSEAMAKHPQAFSALIVSIISAGEESGTIVESYRYLIEHLKWVDDMARRVKKATRYPMIVVCVVLVAVVVMMGFVVPQITQFFDFIQEGGEDLPFATTSLVATSDFFQAFWWVLLGGLISVITAVILGKSLSDRFSYAFDNFILQIPKIGLLLRKISVVRFVKTFSALYTSGIPISDSLVKAKQTVDNMVIKNSLEDIIDFISNGKTISEAMQLSGEFPTMVVQMVQVGEETGRVASVLDQVAEFYNNDIDEEISGMIAMIEPMMTGILGGFILWIAVAVFGPIYSVFDDINI